MADKKPVKKLGRLVLKKPRKPSSVSSGGDHLEEIDQWLQEHTNSVGDFYDERKQIVRLANCTYHVFFNYDGEQTEVKIEDENGIRDCPGKKLYMVCGNVFLGSDDDSDIPDFIDDNDWYELGVNSWF